MVDFWRKITVFDDEVHFFGWRLKNRGVNSLVGNQLWRLVGGKLHKHVSDATQIAFCSLDRLERNNIKHDASSNV